VRRSRQAGTDRRLLHLETQTWCPGLWCKLFCPRLQPESHLAALWLRQDCCSRRLRCSSFRGSLCAPAACGSAGSANAGEKHGVAQLRCCRPALPFYLCRHSCCCCSAVCRSQPPGGCCRRVANTVLPARKLIGMLSSEPVSLSTTRLSKTDLVAA
jgi:hypothetical protein